MNAEKDSRQAPDQAVDPEGVDWLPVSDKLITVRLISGAVWMVVVVGVLSVPLVLRSTGVWAGYPGWLAWSVPGVVLLWFLIGLAITPRQVRAIGYAERHEDLLVKQGILFRRLLVVPYGRMQYVDVQAGPLDRAFGLCKVELHTASSSVTATIPGVPEEEGARLREQLSARGEARLAGL
ncbi:PH domain-containing protein [Zhihengliuella sp.]|uniref:PH domain-containing protein n=1 Tax=Zhihengliuella sp. TaxID=1954483 RepID=UPI002811D0DD|nr:PH domain-containing protein [Zhihengliuella sp.]